MELCFLVRKAAGKKLVIKTRGGKEGGGAVLTGFAKDMIKRFDKLDEEAAVFIEKHYRKTFRK